MPRRPRIPQPIYGGGNRFHGRATDREFGPRATGFALTDPSGNRRAKAFGTSSQIVLANGGYGPVPADALDPDLVAIAALGTTGFAARTGADAWALRTLVAGVNIAITNPAGVAGDPSIAFSRQGLSDTQTGSVNDWVPGAGGGLTGDAFVLWTGASSLSLTGMAGGATNRLAIIKNGTSAQILTLAHQSGSSSAANRFTNLATNGATPLGPGGVAVYVHSGSAWLLVQHDQGSWITPTFAAGDFTASDSMTWTVDSGDVRNDRYYLIGKIAHYQWYYDLTTIGGTLSNTLHRALPAVLNAANSDAAAAHARVIQNGGAVEHGAGYVADSLNPGKLNLILFAGGNYTGGTNNNTHQGAHFWEVK